MTIGRILVAEDDFIVAFDLCETMAEAGYSVEGPHGDISSAMLAVQKNKPDIAILDVNLEDGQSYPLAERLMADDIPVIFHSGDYSVEQMRDRFPQALSCAKPCPPGDLIAKVHEALDHRIPA
ncbi:MAG: response regulator [Altererythrobacter sp.]